MTSKLDQKKKDRFIILNKVYDLTDGHPDFSVSEAELTEGLSYTPEDFDNITTYLVNEGLLKRWSMAADFGITHQGVIEVEEAHTHPEKPTEHFLPMVNVINIQQMTNSQIQQGTSHSFQSQTNNSVEILKELLGKIEDTIQQSSVSEEKKEIASLSCEVIKTQADLPKANRNPSLIKNSWVKLSKLADVIAIGEFISQAKPIIEGLISNSGI